MPSIIAMSVWQGLGINVIIFLAGPPGDPAGVLRRRVASTAPARWSRFRHVTLPLLTPSIFFTGILAPHRRVPGVRPGLRPGPARASRREATITLVYFIYENGFRLQDGLRGAASWILFLIVAALTRRVLPVAAALGALPVTRP